MLRRQSSGEGRFVDVRIDSDPDLRIGPSAPSGTGTGGIAGIRAVAEGVGTGGVAGAAAGAGTSAGVGGGDADAAVTGFASSRSAVVSASPRPPPPVVDAAVYAGSTVPKLKFRRAISALMQLLTGAEKDLRSRLIPEVGSFGADYRATPRRATSWRCCAVMRCRAPLIAGSCCAGIGCPVLSVVGVEGVLTAIAVVIAALCPRSRRTAAAGRCTTRCSTSVRCPSSTSRTGSR
jgi:hypothetical protein